MMETGRYSTIDELAAAEKINSSYVSRLQRLTLLAPFPVEWERQPMGYIGWPSQICWDLRLPALRSRMEGILVCGHCTMPAL